MQNLKFIISGGGTGGHIYPALAIANPFIVLTWQFLSYWILYKDIIYFYSGLIQSIETIGEGKKFYYNSLHSFGTHSPRIWRECQAFRRRSRRNQRKPMRSLSPFPA